jgi:hypothetical protein
MVTLLVSPIALRPNGAERQGSTGSVKLTRNVCVDLHELADGHDAFKVTVYGLKVTKFASLAGPTLISLLVVIPIGTVARAYTLLYLSVIE